jgi:hypothetical protein
MKSMKNMKLPNPGFIIKPKPEVDPLLDEILKVATETREEGDTVQGSKGHHVDDYPFLPDGFLAFKVIYKRICDEIIQHIGIRQNIAEKCHEQNLQIVDALLWMTEEAQGALLWNFMDYNICSISIEAAQVIMSNPGKNIEFDLRYREVK